jgi:signal transduction histidine kinase
LTGPAQAGGRQHPERRIEVETVGHTGSVDLRSLLTWASHSSLRRAVVAASLFVALLGIGVADSVTGPELSFGVFYVLAVVMVTLVAGAAIGTVAALFSAVLSGVADVITSRSGVGAGVDVWNGVTRSGVHLIVVMLLAALLRALRAARESEARSRSFLATAAHQLRTPVAAVSTSVEALLLEGATPAQERLLANVAGEASRLGRLVTSLLRTARLDQGEPLQCQPVDLRELCKQELERVRQLSLLEWRLTVSPATPDLVILDPEATRESLSNLLDNARRHGTSVVGVRVGVADAQVVLEVTDDGPGLPSGTELQAFDRFVTLDGRGGTGLGLAIARELAHRQGGDLVYSHKAFRFTLPLREATSDALAGRL